MADHPFDDEAIKDGIIAFEQEAHILGGRIMNPHHSFQTALTAACNSMKDRGMVREGYSPPWDDGTIMVNTRKYTETNIPVTIIRHKEQS